MLGAEPNTEWLSGAIALDDKGFVLTGSAVGSQEAGWPDTLVNRLANPLATSCPGVFAVGDARCGSLQRVASTVGDGAVVVASVHQALADRRLQRPLPAAASPKL